MKSAPGWLVPAASLFLAAAGVVATAAGVFYLVLGQVAAGGSATGAGLVLLLFATVDRFESIKGLSVEAKLRQLDATLTQAGVLLPQLRAATEELAKSTVHSQPGWGGLTVRRPFDRFMA